MFVQPGSDLHNYLHDSLYEEGTNPVISEGNARNELTMTVESKNSSCNKLTTLLYFYFKKIIKFLEALVIQFCCRWVYPNLENDLVGVVQKLEVLQARLACQFPSCATSPEKDSSALHSPAFHEKNDVLESALYWEGSCGVLLAGMFALFIAMQYRTGSCFAVGMCLLLLLGAMVWMKRTHRCFTESLVQKTGSLSEEAQRFVQNSLSTWQMIRNAQGLKCGLHCAVLPPPVTRVESSIFARRGDSSFIVLKGIRQVLANCLMRVAKEATSTRCSLVCASPEQTEDNALFESTGKASAAYLLQELSEMIAECAEAVHRLAASMCFEIRGMVYRPHTLPVFIPWDDTFQIPALMQAFTLELKAQSAVLVDLLENEGRAVNNLHNAMECFEEPFVHFESAFGQLLSQHKEFVAGLCLWRAELQESFPCVSTIASDAACNEQIEPFVKKILVLRAEQQEKIVGLDSTWENTIKSLQVMSEWHHTNTLETKQQDESQHSGQELNLFLETADQAENYSKKEVDTKSESSLAQIFELQELVASQNEVQQQALTSAPCTEIFTAIGSEDMNEDMLDEWTVNPCGKNSKIDPAKRLKMLGELQTLLGTLEANRPPEKTVTELGCVCHTPSTKCALHTETCDIFLEDCNTDAIESLADKQRGLEKNYTVTHFESTALVEELNELHQSQEQHNILANSTPPMQHQILGRFSEANSAPQHQSLLQELHLSSMFSGNTLAKQMYHEEVFCGSQSDSSQEDL